MAYSALYRRLRPKAFSEVVGQDHVIKTLRNQVASGRVSHAYLFCGTRGTGKTSTALLFARAVNCLSPVGGDACGECEACAALARGGSFNIIEIDAASNNGVENIRDIREEVKYPPAEGKTKTYIIDEAHMLSPSAFNALLKTLEEPPPGVIFILATTDPQKIPATVHSRCQRFDFKKHTASEMASVIERYLASENIAYEPEAVRAAARVSDGSMRDALSVLDQCASFYGDGRVTLERVLEVTGSVDTKVLSRLILSLASGDAAEALFLIDDIIKSGRDAQQAASELLTHARNLLVAVSAGDGAARLLDFSDDLLAEVTRDAKELSAGLLLRYVSAFSELISKMRYAGSPRVLLEAVCIGLAVPEERQGAAAVAEKDAVAARPNSTSRPYKDSSKVGKPGGAEPKPEDVGTSGAGTPAANTVRTEGRTGAAEAVENWGVFLASLGAMDRSMLSGTRPVPGENGTVNIVCGNKGVYDILKAKRETIGAKLAERFPGVSAEIVMDPDYKAKEMARLANMIDMDIKME